MATTAKNSSLVFNLVSNDRSQANQCFSTTSAYGESLSNASKDAPKKGSAQDLYESPQDWGQKDYLFKLAYIFHTNNY
ncbi:hypothetical protein KIN20_033502 [Parelaphostrongylus tenuis]|uniref:Uncharacterized protein n=1 Tax=Parelaphostrongylus tenuis TaxID=148309 RepID=A0AAD5R8P7_PARTN|nr:hypothetical protein KIN20_033502 [Parelaphostrongylus tenuis]